MEVLGIDGGQGVGDPGLWLGTPAGCLVELWLQHGGVRTICRRAAEVRERTDREHASLDSPVLLGISASDSIRALI